MQLKLDRTESGFTVTFYERSYLLAVMKVTHSQAAVGSSQLTLTSCEVTQSLNNRPLVQGRMVYSNGKLVDIKNPHVVANWALKLVLHWVQDRH
jgi:hypothetical protein